MSWCWAATQCSSLCTPNYRCPTRKWVTNRKRMLRNGNQTNTGVWRVNRMSFSCLYTNNYLILWCAASDKSMWKTAAYVKRVFLMYCVRRKRRGCALQGMRFFVLLLRHWLTVKKTPPGFRNVSVWLSSDASLVSHQWNVVVKLVCMLGIQSF